MRSVNRPKAGRRRRTRHVAHQAVRTIRIFEADIQAYLDSHGDRWAATAPYAKANGAAQSCETLTEWGRGAGAPMNQSNGNKATSLLPELLTQTQVSTIFNVSVNTLRYWRHCGDGPNYIKMGRLVRYHADELESYVQRKTCVSKARATAEENRVAH